MDINHISISRESCWNECSVKYKFKYHLKTPIDEEKEYFYYGKIIHSILETYIENGGNMSLGEIVTDVLRDNKPLSTEYQGYLKKDLNNFMRLCNKIGVKGEVEIAFDIDLEQPNKKILTGLIDRMFKHKDKYYIIDYKTTKPGQYCKNELTVLQDLQLQCYAWVIMSQFNVEPKDIIASLYYLRNGKLVSASFSQKTLENTPKRLLAVYDEIVNTHPDEALPTVGGHCNRCDFKHLCESYKQAKKFGYI